MIVSFDEASAWTVTGTCYLSALHIAQGANICGKDGKTVRLTVNGAPTPLVPGSYTGQLVVDLAD